MEKFKLSNKVEKKPVGTKKEVVVNRTERLESWKNYDVVVIKDSKHMKKGETYTIGGDTAMQLLSMGLIELR